MSITKLMADPKAASNYIAIDGNRAPLVLADDYILAKLAGDVPLCTALEIYLRDLARVYFHRGDVLEALSQMERYKEKRKPGAGGTKDLKAIADQIERDYTRGNFQMCDDGRIKFRIGSLAVTCKDKPGVVALVVAKYRRGMPKSRGGRYGTINVR